MNFGIIYKLRDKRNWWVDVVFYFVISLLVALVICAFIFSIKTSFQEKAIKDFNKKLAEVGNEQQKEAEKQVFTYQKKINDFAQLLGNHKSALNIFSFFEQYTLPNVWFSKFGMDEKQSEVMLSGESEDMKSLSKQISAFEAQDSVKKIDLLNSSVSSSGRVNFNLNLSLDPKLFAFVPKPLTPAETPAVTEGPATVTPSENGEIPAENGGQNQGATKSNKKYITSFDFSLDGQEIAGSIDQTKYTVLVEVPSGTDVGNLSPAITLSPNAEVEPASLVSQDFTKPVVYTVTAEDLSAQGYTVTVIVAEPPVVKSSSSKAGIIAAVIFILIIAGGAAGVWFFWKKKKKETEY